MPQCRAEKVLESYFPLAAVDRLVQAGLRSHRCRHPVSRWWYPRPIALWRSLLLAGLIEQPAWQALEPSAPPHDASGALPENTPEPDTGPIDAWDRLYYRLDDEANRTIRNQVHGREVLDLFAGGGVALSEAMRLGTDFVGLCSDPVAWFTLKKSTDGVPLATLRTALSQLEASVRSEIEAGYRVTCPHCRLDALARHTYWVRCVTCPVDNCRASIPLFSSLLLFVPVGRDQDVLVVCPACGSVYLERHDVLAQGATCPVCATTQSAERLESGFMDGATVTCQACHTRHNWRQLLAQQATSYRMVALEVACPACGQVTYKQPDAHDMVPYDQACQQLEQDRQALRLPEGPIPAVAKDRVGRALNDFGLRNWVDMFNPRQLRLLARLRDAILALPDSEAGEHLLLAWVDTMETYNMASTYLPGSRWTHTIYSPRPMVPWSLSIESCLWGQPDLPDTFRGQVELALTDMARAWEPADLRLTPDGRHAYHPSGDAAVPARARRVLLRQPAHSLADAQLAPRSIDLAIVDTPRVDPVTMAYLSDYLYAWLRTALARDYPVAFAGREIRKLPFDGHGSALTETLGQLAPCLADDGLVVQVLRRRFDQPWGDSLSPLLDAGYSVRALHPVRLGSTAGDGLLDRCRCEGMVLAVARKGQPVTGAGEWAHLAPEMAADMNACLDDWWPQVAAGCLSSADVAVEALGAGMRRLCGLAGGGGLTRATWHDQPVSVAQALDGDGQAGLVGLVQMVDLLVFQREVQLWPTWLDETSRLYLTTLLGQTVLPQRRLAWRLEAVTGLTLEDLSRQRLVLRQADRIRVKTAAQRSTYLRRRWGLEQAQLTQPGLPGLASGGTILTAIDRLHLLLGVMQNGEEIEPWLIGWSRLDGLAELAQEIAERLSHSPRRRRYARLAARLRGVG